MKSLLKVAALLVVAMPLFAAEPVMSTTNGTAAAPMVDCSKMMGAAKDKCMKDLEACNKMTVAADKAKCMADMNKGAAKDMGTMNKDMGTMNNGMENMNKTAQ